MSARIPPVLLLVGIGIASACVPTPYPPTSGIDVGSESGLNPHSQSSAKTVDRQALLALQQGLISGETSPNEILEFVAYLLEFYDPETPRREVTGLDEVWRRFDLLENKNFGTITLSVLCAGPAEEPRKVIMLIRQNEASYLPQDIDVVDSEFRINLGLDSKRLVYCASSLHARVAPTSELAAQLEGKSSSICIGATLKVRDGISEWAEIRLDLSTANGKLTTTSRIAPSATRKAADFGEIPEVIHLGEVLTALAAN